MDASQKTETFVNISFDATSLKQSEQTLHWDRSAGRSDFTTAASTKSLDQLRTVSNQAWIALFASTVIEHPRCRAMERSAEFAPVETTAVRPGVLFPGRDGTSPTVFKLICVSDWSIY